MKALIFAPLGAVVGLAMGAVGGGGSLIAIPILVYLVDQEPRAAQGTALVIVIAAAAVAAVSYLSADAVRWRAGIAFGLAAGVSAFAGSLLSRELNPDVLLLAFSPVMVAGAIAMLSGRARGAGGFRPWRYGVDVPEVARVIALGLGIGWIIGLFGVGGGFVIVPALVLVLGLSMTEAVGTSLLVLVIASLFALGDRIDTGDVDWAVAAPFAAAAVAVSIAGRSLAEQISTRRLALSFAAVLLAAAAYTAVRSLLDLSWI